MVHFALCALLLTLGSATTLAMPRAVEDDLELALDEDETLDGQPQFGVEPAPPPAEAKSDTPDEIEADLREPAEADAKTQLAAQSAPKPDADENSESRPTTEQLRVLRYHRDRLDDRDIEGIGGDEEPPHNFHIAGGLHFNATSTPNQSQGTLDFQVSLARHFSLGVYGNYSNQSYLGVGTLNYYSRRPYEGIWVQVGGGYEVFQSGFNNVLGDQRVKATSIVAFDMGWRWLGTNNLTFGFGSGINGYFFVPQPKVVFNLKVQIGLAWNIWPH